MKNDLSGKGMANLAKETLELAKKEHSTSVATRDEQKKTEVKPNVSNNGFTVRIFSEILEEHFIIYKVVKRLKGD